MNTATKAGAHTPTHQFIADGVDIFIESPHGRRRVASCNSLAFTVCESEEQAKAICAAMNLKDELVRLLEGALPAMQYARNNAAERMLQSEKSEFAPALLKRGNKDIYQKRNADLLRALEIMCSLKPKEYRGKIAKQVRRIEATAQALAAAEGGV